MPFFPPLLNEPTHMRLKSTAHTMFLQSILDNMIYNSKSVLYRIENNDTSITCAPFVHLTTKDNSDRTMRIFDPERTKRIHWISPLLQNITSEKVFVYEKYYGKSVRVHLFVPSRFFILVLVPENSGNRCYYIITSFNLDNPNRVGYHMAEYNKYKRNNYQPI